MRLHESLRSNKKQRVARPEVLRRACCNRWLNHALRSTSGRATQFAISTADLAELPTQYNRFNRDGEAIVIRFQPLLHLLQQRLIGKLHAAAECVAQELAAKLADDGVAPRVQEVVAQARQTVDFLAVRGFCLHVDRPSRKILVATPADGVEALEGEAERVDLVMARGAAG